MSTNLHWKTNQKVIYAKSNLDGEPVTPHLGTNIHTTDTKSAAVTVHWKPTNNQLGKKCSTTDANCSYTEKQITATCPQCYAGTAPCGRCWKSQTVTHPLWPLIVTGKQSSSMETLTVKKQDSIWRQWFSEGMVWYGVVLETSVDSRFFPW